MATLQNRPPSNLQRDETVGTWLLLLVGAVCAPASPTISCKLKRPRSVLTSTQRFERSGLRVSAFNMFAGFHFRSGCVVDCTSTHTHTQHLLDTVPPHSDATQRCAMVHRMEFDCCPLLLSCAVQCLRAADAQRDISMTDTD